MTTTPTTPSPLDTSSRIYLALETAWRDLQRRHPDLPDVFVTFTTGSNDKRHHEWTCHRPERWQAAQLQHAMLAAGLDLSGELLALGGRRILQALLHDATHALAAVRRIKDTSSGGRYHNRRFAHLAHELGLTPPTEPDSVRGLAACTLDDQAAAGWTATISTLDGASSAYLANPSLQPPATVHLDHAPGDTTPRRAGRRLKVACACPQPRTLQVTPKSLEDGPILCGICQQPFQPASPSSLVAIRSSTDQ